MVTQYLSGKEKDWNAYRTHVNSWEIGKYLVAY